MKQPTLQKFISVSATYVPKNALEKHGQNELMRLNNLLCTDLKQVKSLIQKAVDKANKECPTAKRCKPLNIKYWDNDGNSLCCRVNDLITLSIHPVFIQIKS